LGDFVEILYAKDKVNGYWVNFNNKTRATELRAQPSCNDANQRDRHPRERHTEETKTHIGSHKIRYVRLCPKSGKGY
jgi:hypothetical protein